MNWKLIPALLLCFLLLASIPQSPVAASNSENISDDSQKQTLSLPETSTSVQVENNLSGTSTIVGGPENYPEFSEFDSAMERSAETLDNFAATLQKLFNTLPRLGEAILAENGKDEIFGAYDPWAENYKQTLQRLKDSTPKMIDAFDNLVEKLSIFASNGVIPDTYVPVLEKEVVRLRGWFDNLIMAADGLADHLSRLRRDTLENCEALGQITDEISNSIQKVRDAINQLVVPEDLLNLSENSDTTTGAILGENDEPEVGLRPENIPELERYNEAVISFAGAMDDFGVVIAVLDYILPLFRDFGPTESLGEVLPLYEQQLSEYELTLQTLKEVLSEKEDSFSALIARFSEFAAAGALSIDEVQELEEIAIDHGKWAENLTAAADELADRLNTIYDSVTENSNSSCINIAKEILNDGLHSLVNAWETLTGPTDGTCALTAWVSNSTPEPGQPVTLYVQVYHDCERQADDHRLTGSVCATIPGLGSVSIGSFDLGYLSSTTLTREFTAPQTAGDYSIGVTASYTHTWSTLETIWVPYYYTYTWTEVVTRKVWVQKTVTELVWFPGVPQPILVTHTVWVEEERTEYITHEETVFGGYRQEQIRRSHSESGDEYKSASFKVRQPDVTPPTISNVSHLPEPPEKDDLVHVFADISDDIAVDSVALIYYNGAIDSVTMWRISGDERSGTYGCYIPEQPPGVTVFCIIHACDRAGNETTQSFSYVVKGRIETTLSIEDFKCTFEGGLPFGPAWHVSFKAYLRDDSGQPVAGKKIGLYREDEGPLLVTSPGYFTVAELITGDDGRTSVFIFYVDKLDVPAIGGGALELDICHSTGYFHVKFKGDDLYEESESKSVEIPPTGSSPATALPVNSGIYTGSLNETDNEDYYKTYVNGGQTIAISMTPGCDFDLYLYDPEKNLVASSTRRGDSLTESIIYTATMLGDHYIRIHWISGLGTYSLAIDKTPPTIPSIEENHCGRTWTNYGSPYWYWSASDPETRIARYEVYCSWVDNTFYTTDASYHPTLMDGSHHIKVRAQNGAEIWSSWSPAV